MTPVPLAADVAVARTSTPAHQSGPNGQSSVRDANADNAVYFEALGNGLLYSVSYEQLFSRYDVGLRAGAGFITYKVSSANGSGNLTLASLPLVASYYWGSPRHKLQLGLGATVLYFDASSDSTGTKFEGSGTGLSVAATAVIGYRYMPKARGFTFGAGFTPLLRAAKGFLPWGGIGVGYAF